MSMLGKLKQFKDLRKQAKDIQAQLQSIEETGKADGGRISVTIDGSQSIKNITISDELLSAGNGQRIADGIKSAHADAMKAIQKVMAEKMRKGELSMPDLSDLQG